MTRVYNFSAGPAILPEQVLNTIQHDLLNFKGSGMSVLEMSHRSKPFEAIIEKTEQSIRRLLNISDDYAVLFLQGGASTQFAMIPMNLAQEGKPVDVIHTGVWSGKAIDELKKLVPYRIIASGEDSKFTQIPDLTKINFNADASYVHMTSNNTIYGTQSRSFPNTGNIPLVADMSSDIFSYPFDINQFGLVYAGAQKNAGAAGVTLVIIKKELAERCNPNIPTMFQYRTHIKNTSLYNTPPTFSIYVMGLVAEWIESKGGLAAMKTLNEAKAKVIYDVIDKSSFYNCPNEPKDRSLMNVVFRINRENAEELEKKFVAEATAQGLTELKGHRSAGGLRASIYNAMPLEGCKALAQFMLQFEKNN